MELPSCMPPQKGPHAQLNGRARTTIIAFFFQSRLGAHFNDGCLNDDVLVLAVSFVESSLIHEKRILGKNQNGALQTDT